MKKYIICVGMLLIMALFPNIAYLNGQDSKSSVPLANPGDKELLERYETLCVRLHLMEKNEVFSPTIKTAILTKEYHETFDCPTVEVRGVVDIMFEMGKEEDFTYI